MNRFMRDANLFHSCGAGLLLGKTHIILVRAETCNVTARLRRIIFVGKALLGCRLDDQGVRCLTSQVRPARSKRQMAGWEVRPIESISSPPMRVP